MHFKTLLPFLAAALLAFNACDSDDPNYNLSGKKKPTPTTATRDADRLEMPKMTADDLFIIHRTDNPSGNDSIVNYAYAYDTRYFHSKWVAFRFDKDTRPKNVARKDYSIRPKYPRDPKLPTLYALTDDITFNGYDHGHLCASADRLYSREANDQTFYLSNMSPQIGQFNQNYWTAFEQKVQDLGRDASFADTLYVVKGGTLNDPDQFLGFVAGNKVPVPTHYYMALLKVKNGSYTAIGFLLEHKNYGVNGSDKYVRQHVVSIRQLEQATGINFFHNLPDAVENAVEGTAPVLSAWKL